MTSPTASSTPPASPTPPDWVTGALACPRCRSRLADDLRACGNSACDLSRPSSFPQVNGTPCLVDFAASVIMRDRLEASAAASPVRRRGGWLRDAINRAVFGHNRVADGNAVRLLTHLPADRPIRLLIVGGGARGAGVDRLLADPRVQPLISDIYRSAETVLVADAHSLPLADASVDAVWIQAVLEHVVDPVQVAAEIHRVLRPDGLLYAETPFLQAVHEGPYDFTRFTERGHRALFTRFEALGSGAIGGPGTTLIWALRYALAGLLRSYRLGLLATLPFAWLRLIDRLVPEPFALDAANGVWFLGRKRAETESLPDLIAGYRGAL